MGKVVVLIRGKATKTRAGDFKETEFSCLGGNKIQDSKGTVFHMVVTRPDGGVLRNGADVIHFRFPR